ncbi:hypothetical protein BC829DRAFT_400370, partial [Chytridium lagenaria]
MGTSATPPPSSMGVRVGSPLMMSSAAPMQMMQNGMQVRPTYMQGPSGPIMVSPMNGQMYAHPPNSNGMMMMQTSGGPMMTTGISTNDDGETEREPSMQLQQQQGTMMMMMPQGASPNNTGMTAIQTPKRSNSTPVPAPSFVSPSHHVMTVLKPVSWPPHPSVHLQPTRLSRLPPLTSPTSSSTSSSSSPPPSTAPTTPTPHHQIQLQQQMHIQKLQQQHQALGNAVALHLPQRPQSAMAATPTTTTPAASPETSFMASLQNPPQEWQFGGSGGESLPQRPSSTPPLRSAS